ncbi:MAG: hypothetical protein NVSMB56_04480 [Pyrinomonadaceae bacterium]
MSQPTLFEELNKKFGTSSEMILYALGEFQARGKVLAGRELPLDRLRGALRRAAEDFGVEEVSDEDAANALQTLGAKVQRRPSYFAKHPFRVIVPHDLAEHARDFYEQTKQKLNAAEKQ